MAGQKAEPPVRFLKAPVAKGDTWNIESKIAGMTLKVEYTADEEEVTVPAGKYKAVLTKTSEFDAGGQKAKATVWYGKGVGMVKTDLDIGGMKVQLELSKFTPGK
jgi:hypothetical protein